MGHELDDVDRGILFLLQQDAKETTALEMADTLDVSASTVRNRLSKLEENDVLKGYYPLIDYENANLPPRVLFTVTASPTDRSGVTEAILDIHGVVTVRELLIGQQNLSVEVVPQSSSHLTQIIERIHELEARIDRTEIVSQRYVQPLGFFGDALEIDDTRGNFTTL